MLPQLTYTRFPTVELNSPTALINRNFTGSGIFRNSLRNSGVKTFRHRSSVAVIRLTIYSGGIGSGAGPFSGAPLAGTVPASARKGE